MSVYRRFVRSKRGMSTVFGGLFFVILILMGFNVMLWSFIQFDAYNNVITATGLRDQQAQSELLVFNPPGASGFRANSFNITVGNQGGSTVTIAAIYITNISPTNSPQCQGTSLCIIPSSSPTRSFSNSNIPPGELNHVMTVKGMSIGDAAGGGGCGSGYKVVLATSRGRQFSFFCPWPVNLGGGGPSNSNSTNTAHGALDVKFDLSSFNFTENGMTVPVEGWTVPYQTNVVWWVKVVNNAIQPITLSRYTSLYFVCYQDRFGSGSGTCTETDLTYVVDNQTINPGNVIAYDDVDRPYVLPAAGPNGPTGFTVVKFGSFYPAGTQPQDVDYPTPYLVFMGFFYKINGVIMGQTISFVAIRACATYPSCP